MKLKSAIYLFAVFLALFAYLYFYEMPTQKNIEMQQEVKEKIFDFNEEKLLSFSFKTPENDIIIKRVEGADGFIIEKPVNANADAGAVNKFLSELRDVKAKSVITGDDLKPEDFGLVLPFYTITLNFNDSSQKTFKFGNMNIKKDMIYVSRNDDNNVYMLDLDSRKVVDLDLYGLREKLLVKEDFTDLGRIQAVQEDSEIILEKENDEWFIRQPIQLKADIVEVRALINNLKGLKAVKFPEDNIEGADKFDYSKPYFSLNLTSSDGKTIQRIMLSKKGPMIAKRLTIDEAEKEDCATTGEAPPINTLYFKKWNDDGIYLITIDDFKFLSKSLNEYRAKPIFTARKNDIYRIEIFRDKKQLVLARDGNDNWNNVSIRENPVKFDENDIVNIFNYLYFVEAKEFIDNAKMEDEIYNFKNPALSLAFFDKNGNILEKLVIGNEREGHVFLQRHNDSTVYMIDAVFKDRFKL